MGTIMRKTTYPDDCIIFEREFMLQQQAVQRKKRIVRQAELFADAVEKMLDEKAPKKVRGT